MSKRNISIYLEANPNPNSMKFVANVMLVPPGKSYDFPDFESASSAPLAQKLFMFDYVQRVFYMSNFITITKKSEVEWIEIQDILKRLIKEYLEGGYPLLTVEGSEEVEVNKVSPAVGTDNDSETSEKIKSILEEYVRPAVEQDGGAITFHSYQDGVVKVLLQGSCSGCPSSTITLKAGIENLLKKLIPEVKAVEAQGI